MRLASYKKGLGLEGLWIVFLIYDSQGEGGGANML